MVVIKSEQQYQQFLSDIALQKVFVDYVIADPDKHPKYQGNPVSSAPYTRVIAIFIKNIDSNVTYCINIWHQDVHNFELNHLNVIPDIVKVTKNVFVTDKKRFMHIFGHQEVDDIILYKFQEGLIEHDTEDFTTKYHDFVKTKQYNQHKLNNIVPLAKHLEAFEDKFDYYKNDMLNFITSDAYRQMNTVIAETLCDIEANGMKVNLEEYNKHFSDKPIELDMVYTEYNLYTSTGRPSNHFGGINYAALKKDDGSRRSFVSRFGNDGMLITMDYSAYHPRIIANLVKYPIGMGVNIYEYLGKQFFNTDTIDVELLKKAKQLTFLNLYGGVKDEYLHIPYFQKVNEYVKHRWEFFNENGYVETPIFKRRITKNHIIDANPNKLFNYILQSSEIEFGMPLIKRINEYLKTKQSRVVLYVYDSILVDAYSGDGVEMLKTVRDILVNEQFPVKCYAGRTYHNMAIIDL